MPSSAPPRSTTKTPQPRSRLPLTASGQATSFCWKFTGLDRILPTPLRGSAASSPSNGGPTTSPPSATRSTKESSLWKRPGMASKISMMRSTPSLGPGSPRPGGIRSTQTIHRPVWSWLEQARPRRTPTAPTGVPIDPDWTIPIMVPVSTPKAGVERSRAPAMAICRAAITRPVGHRHLLRHVKCLTDRGGCSRMFARRPPRSWTNSADTRPSSRCSPNLRLCSAGRTRPSRYPTHR